jgi:hypothetical protein
LIDIIVFGVGTNSVLFLKDNSRASDPVQVSKLLRTQILEIEVSSVIVNPAEILVAGVR